MLSNGGMKKAMGYVGHDEREKSGWRFNK